MYDLFGHATAGEHLPGGHEIYNFGRVFLVIIMNNAPE